MDYDQGEQPAAYPDRHYDALTEKADIRSVQTPENPYPGPSQDRHRATRPYPGNGAVSGGVGPRPGRRSGRHMLQQLAAQYRHQAEQLDALAEALPAALDRLAPAADEALWRIIQEFARLRER